MPGRHLVFNKQEIGCCCGFNFWSWSCIPPAATSPALTASAFPRIPPVDCWSPLLTNTPHVCVWWQGGNRGRSGLSQLSGARDRPEERPWDFQCGSHCRGPHPGSTRLYRKDARRQRLRALSWLLNPGQVRGLQRDTPPPRSPQPVREGTLVG